MFVFLFRLDKKRNWSCLGIRRRNSSCENHRCCSHTGNDRVGKNENKIPSVFCLLLFSIEMHRLFSFSIYQNHRNFGIPIKFSMMLYQNEWNIALAKQLNKLLNSKKNWKIRFSNVLAMQFVDKPFKRKERSDHAIYLFLE